MKVTRTRHHDGKEYLDPAPLEPPLGYRKAPSLSEQIRLQVLMSKLADLDAMEESEEEADDFEVGDDFEPYSPHENDHMPSIKVLKQRAKEINEEIQRRNMEALRDRLQKEQSELRGGAAAPPATEKKPPSDGG